MYGCQKMHLYIRAVFLSFSAALILKQNLWGYVAEVFSAPNVLPVIQRSVSKRRALAPTSGLTSSFLHPPPDF